MPKPLNSRQESFCALMAAGSSAGRAYEKAGYESHGNVADSAAERLMRNVEIRNRIAELRKPVTKKLLLTKDRKREILRDIAEDTERLTMVRLRAVEIDAKLAGHFEPDRVEMEIGPSLLESTRERALAIVSMLDRNRDVRGNPAIVRDATPSTLQCGFQEHPKTKQCQLAVTGSFIGASVDLPTGIAAAARRSFYGQLEPSRSEPLAAFLCVEVGDRAFRLLKVRSNASLIQGRSPFQSD